MDTNRKTAAAGSGSRFGAVAAMLTVVATLACGDPAGPSLSSSGPSNPTGPLPTSRMSDSAMVIARSSGAALSPAVDYNFYDVKAYPEGMAVTVFFKYTGNMTPILTVGYAPDVYASTKGWAAAKYLGDGKWQARVPGLETNTKYYYRLENLGGGKFSSWFKTLRRQVVVDIDWVQVDFDGDAGAPCGELHFRTRVQTGWYSGYPYDSYTNEYGICSGYGQGFIGSDGRWSYDDWKYDHLYVIFGAMDSDSCYAWTSMCGDIGYSDSKGFDVRPYGSQKFTLKTIGNVNATFTGKVVVNYIP